MSTNNERLNSLWNSAAFIVVSILSLVNFTLNVKTYNSNIFGIYILLIAIFNLGNNLDFGFGVSTVKVISESKVHDYKELNSIFVSFLVVYLSLALLLYSGFNFYYYFFFNKIAPDQIYQTQLDFNLLFHLLNLTFVCKYLVGFLNKVFDGLQEFILFSKINIIYNVILTSLITVVYILKLSLVYLVLFTLSANFLFLTVLFMFLHFKLGVKIQIKNINFTIIKSNFKYNLNLQFSFFISSFIDPVIKYLIANLLSLNFVTYFETAKKIIDISNGLIFSAQKNLLNNLSQAQYLNKLKQYINENIFKYTKLSNYYSITFYGLLNPLIFIFINYWFNLESAIIYLLFSIAYSFINFGGSKYLVLMISSEGKFLVIIQFLNLVMTSLLLYISLVMFNSYLGLSGYIIGIILNTLIILKIMNKYYQLNIWTYFKKTMFVKVIISNVLIIIEFVALVIYPEYKFIILGTFLIIFIFFSYKDSMEAFNIILRRRISNA
ncbi:MAG: hypothetical protein K1X86_07605 [Ignavibacteria bacterium]|nr:hypothetical protein [Ignavibacteria bacterium]